MDGFLRSTGAAVAVLALAACGTLPSSPLATEVFAKREQALHIALSWNCRLVEPGGILIEGVVEDTYRSQPILNLRFAATAYEKDGKRLIHAVGFPDGIRIGYEAWTRFRVLVPRGQAAAKIDLAYEYRLPGGSEGPLMPGLFPLFRFAQSEEYFATIPDACRA